jgi:anti-sigma regulatory factor (Ser/Thr protein kinase)
MLAPSRFPIIADVRMPAEARYGYVVRSLVLARARLCDIHEEDLECFLTALGEALANAIEHAGSKNPIRVRCRLDSMKISATISDSGSGFAQNAFSLTLPHPTAEHGRGVPLMRRCSDIFHVRSIPGKGTTVLIVRFITTRNATNI